MHPTWRWRVLLFQDKTDAEYAKLAEQHVAALNKALDGIPSDQVRLHVCWGNWEGPHTHDVAMEVILPALYQAKVGALSLEFASPRRQHEAAALRKHKLPDDFVLIPGVIDPKSNIVEHPEVVAQRIENVAAAVGDRERVIAGVDCGFGTFAGWEWVTEDVVWSKLAALRTGADIASRRLWGRKRRRLPADHTGPQVRASWGPRTGSGWCPRREWVPAFAGMDG
jgi:5-methyltetrahydropteroyltriglutamate--homocysteine methyltransferase